jgi:hypothetical protein
LKKGQGPFGGRKVEKYAKITEYGLISGVYIGDVSLFGSGAGMKPE